MDGLELFRPGAVSSQGRDELRECFRYKDGGLDLSRDVGIGVDMCVVSVEFNAIADCWQHGTSVPRIIHQVRVEPTFP